MFTCWNKKALAIKRFSYQSSLPDQIGKGTAKVHLPGLSWASLVFHNERCQGTVTEPVHHLFVLAHLNIALVLHMSWSPFNTCSQPHQAAILAITSTIEVLMISDKCAFELLNNLIELSAANVNRQCGCQRHLTNHGLECIVDQNRNDAGKINE